MRHKLGTRIKSDGHVYKIEKNFFAIYAEHIADAISTLSTTNQLDYIIYLDDTIASAQMNFVVDMMKRYM